MSASKKGMSAHQLHRSLGHPRLNFGQFATGLPAGYPALSERVTGGGGGGSNRSLRIDTLDFDFMAELVNRSNPVGMTAASPDV